MSTIPICDSNKLIEIKSSYISGYSYIYKFLIVDDIYKLTKIANKYVKYCKKYNDVQNIAFEIYNKNTIANCFKKDFNIYITNVIEIFKKIKIPIGIKTNKDDLFCYFKELNFSIVSKNILEEKKFMKMLFPFTKILDLSVDGEKNILFMLKDIMQVAYNYHYNVNIVWPIDNYDDELDEYTAFAYKLVGLSIK